jgi:hypothetical protein
LCFDELRAHSIGRVLGMLPTINFDDDTRLVASEIHDVWAKSYLPSEMRPLQGQSVQMPPQLLLGICRHTPHGASEHCLWSHAPAIA